MATRKRTVRYPAGTQVVSTVGMRGEVLAHVTGASGGSYHVRWENGHAGYIAPRLVEKAPPPDDPRGYIVSENYGDDLYHYDTLARAIQGADAAVSEGAEAADVWHAVSTFSTEIDYDSTVEYSVRKKDIA
jgi:hypothetical protein